VTTSTVTAIDFSALLDTLGHTEGEFTSLLAVLGNGNIRTWVFPSTEVVAASAKMPAGTDHYFSVNTVEGPARTGGGRGGQENVTRVAALYADIDVKVGACRNLLVAQAVIAEVAHYLGVKPSVVVSSGGGLQPYWPISDCTDPDVGAVLLARFHTLVNTVAARHGAKMDNVCETARMLRIPGSQNMKIKGQPRPVTADRNLEGRPMTVAEVTAALDNAGIIDTPTVKESAGGSASGHTEVSLPSTWEWSDRTCEYIAKMVGGFRTDSPLPGGGRSPWLISQRVRLLCAHRQGCITATDYGQAQANLEARFAEVVADPAIDIPREVKPKEHHDTSKAAVKIATRHTDAEVAAELGNHSHYDDRANIADVGPEFFDIEQTDQPTFTFTSGGKFIFDQPDTIPAIWGSGTDVLWAEGESLMIAGPMGLGKTTLGGQVVRARLGLGNGYVLGLPVADSGGVILYLAMDRPRQIARSLGRQFHGEDERARADARLVVWQGPPPADIAANPGLLLRLAQAAGADTVVIDSVKDAAVGLTNDEVGAGYNRARQLLIAAGIDLLELHHTVKRGAGGGAPTAAADVYGSAWIANGTGSIILLSGDPGDPIVGFKHIRQPADEVGPWQVHHDQSAGRLTISESFDVVAFVADCGRNGATAIALAEALNTGLQWLDDRERNSAREKARRQLERLVAAGKLQRLDGDKGGGSDRTPTAYFLAAVNHEAITQFTRPQVEQSRTEAITEAITQPSRQSRETAKPQAEQSRTQSRTTPAKPITQPTLPVGEVGARGGWNKGQKTKNTGSDPVCAHCDEPVVGKQRDGHGNPAHFACQANTKSVPQ
jgi:hypothetical protein